MLLLDNQSVTFYYCEKYNFVNRDIKYRHQEKECSQNIRKWVKKYNQEYSLSSNQHVK